MHNEPSQAAAFGLASATAVAETAAEGDGLIIVFQKVSTHFSPVAAARHSRGTSHGFVGGTPKGLAPVLNPDDSQKTATQNHC